MHVLIVSYSFPPSKEIGGRRWSKFAKYIYREHHDVTVITSENVLANNETKSEFNGIEFHYIHPKYPVWLTGHTKNIVEKLLYFFFVRFVNKIIRFNIFDKGIFWKSELIKKITDINNTKEVNVLIITGAPFSLLYYGTLIKNKFKSIFYVIDLRDPWLETDKYGIKTMSSRKFNYQKKMEKDCVYSSDLVTLPTPFMIKLFRNKYPEISNKYYLLPHAYDTDKFNNINFNSERKHLIYGGTIYNKTEKLFIQLDNVFTNNPDLDLCWNIYTNTDITNYKKIIKNLDKFNFQDFIPENELFKKIASSIAYLILLPDEEKDFISTKIFEIIYLKTPIICISNPGELSEFIVKNSLGVHILPQNIEDELPEILKSKLTINVNFPIHEYSFQYVTKKFLQTISDRL